MSSTSPINSDDQTSIDHQEEHQGQERKTSTGSTQPHTTTTTTNMTPEEIALRHQNEVSTLKKTISDLRLGTQVQAFRLSAKYRAERSQIQTSHETEVRRLKATHNNEMNQAKKEHQDEFDLLLRQFQHKIDQVSNETEELRQEASFHMSQNQVLLRHIGRRDVTRFKLNRKLRRYRKYRNMVKQAKKNVIKKTTCASKKGNKK